MIVPFVQHIRRGLLFICYKVFGDTSKQNRRTVPRFLFIKTAFEELKG